MTSDVTWPCRRVQVWQRSDVGKVLLRVAGHVRIPLAGDLNRRDAARPLPTHTDRPFPQVIEAVELHSCMMAIPLVGAIVHSVKCTMRSRKIDLSLLLEGDVVGVGSFCQSTAQFPDKEKTPPCS